MSRRDPEHGQATVEWIGLVLGVALLLGAVAAGSEVLKRTWFLCLGYRRWQYDREHPRSPLEGVPLRETVKTVNECVNPLSFLFG
jgi:hypothetical protein